jgi:hypothetical protein
MTLRFSHRDACALDKAINRSRVYESEESREYAFMPLSKLKYFINNDAGHATEPK